jgi:hypothetical protein
MATRSRKKRKTAIKTWKKLQENAVNQASVSLEYDSPWSVIFNIELKDGKIVEKNIGEYTLYLEDDNDTLAFGGEIKEIRTNKGKNEVLGKDDDDEWMEVFKFADQFGSFVSPSKKETDEGIKKWEPLQHNVVHQALVQLGDNFSVLYSTEVKDGKLVEKKGSKYKFFCKDEEGSKVFIANVKDIRANNGKYEVIGDFPKDSDDEDNDEEWMEVEEFAQAHYDPY